ncbi:hypothetical protein SAMN05216232_0189 [Virgibacillus subterraneus]|uniref:IrrE N-terminal-like domain-containing protein n=1 Tax=Virgibacillus subterraneus TaxID=621109 RepID=A0A1H8YXS4_9BACI|nr:hypothetical protein [Virgibacillus subterraneus]SEP56994.1 hypothetical protein SAMN05216232_0189 [Virgibacillus subterraneus]
MIPNKINVAGVEYDVSEVETVIIDGSTNYAGSCSYSDSRIEVLNSMVPTKKEQSFVHELLHACFHEAGFNEQDEDVINRVSNVLYQVLKDNKLTFE